MCIKNKIFIQLSSIILIFLNSISYVFAKNCFYLKKVEYTDGKIINSTTKYKCNVAIENNNMLLKPKVITETIYVSEPKIIETSKTYVSQPIISKNNHKNKTYIRSRPISHSEYMNMVYYGNNSQPNWNYNQSEGIIGKVLHAFARIILLQ